MILAAAVCPHPPLLVPAVAPGTTDELAPLRDACADAVDALIATSPERVVVIGSGTLPADLDESAGGTLAGYGADVTAGGADHVLPLSLAVGAWLLDAAGWTGPRTYSTGRPDVHGRVALLVMADGTDKRSLKAPGFLDERAEGFDAGIAAALAAGDPAALTRLDPELGAELGAAGIEPLRTMGDTIRGDMTKGATVAAHVRYDGAPLGVGYVVADWVVA